MKKTNYHFIYTNDTVETLVCKLVYTPKRESTEPKDKDCDHDAICGCGYRHTYWHAEIEENLDWWKPIDIVGVGHTLIIAGGVLCDLVTNPQGDIQQYFSQYITSGHDIRLYREEMVKL